MLFPHFVTAPNFDLFLQTKKPFVRWIVDHFTKLFSAWKEGIFPIKSVRKIMLILLSSPPTAALSKL